jgi:hypothetical protein
VNDDELAQFLIDTGEAVEYGDPWTERTTHEWWGTAPNRKVRLVMMYHGRGRHGDDDEAEYVRRLLDMGRARELSPDHSGEVTEQDKEALRNALPMHITHVVTPAGTAIRIRHYVPAPEVSDDGATQQ